jgi:hypothetical protein
MEARFGGDFGSVRLHTGTAAARSAQALGAQAFTVGREIVFGAGKYAPGTSSGKRLLAHELAHTIQQSRGGAAPPTNRPGSPLEQDASQAAERAVQGGAPAQVSASSAPGPALQPLPEDPEQSAFSTSQDYYTGQSFDEPTALDPYSESPLEASPAEPASPSQSQAPCLVDQAPSAAEQPGSPAPTSQDYFTGEQPQSVADLPAEGQEMALLELCRQWASAQPAETPGWYYVFKGGEWAQIHETEYQNLAASMRGLVFGRIQTLKESYAGLIQTYRDILQVNKKYPNITSLAEWFSGVNKPGDELTIQLDQVLTQLEMAEGASQGGDLIGALDHTAESAKAVTEASRLIYGYSNCLLSGSETLKGWVATIGAFCLAVEATVAALLFAPAAILIAEGFLGLEGASATLAAGAITTTGVTLMGAQQRSQAYLAAKVITGERPELGGALEEAAVGAKTTFPIALGVATGGATTSLLEPVKATLGASLVTGIGGYTGAASSGLAQGLLEGKGASKSLMDAQLLGLTGLAGGMLSPAVSPLAARYGLPTHLLSEGAIGFGSGASGAYLTGGPVLQSGVTGALQSIFLSPATFPQLPGPGAPPPLPPAAAPEGAPALLAAPVHLPEIKPGPAGQAGAVGPIPGGAQQKPPMLTKNWEPFDLETTSTQETARPSGGRAKKPKVMGEGSLPPPWLAARLLQEQKRSSAPDQPALYAPAPGEGAPGGQTPAVLAPRKGGGGGPGKRKKGGQPQPDETGTAPAEPAVQAPKTFDWNVEKDTNSNLKKLVERLEGENADPKIKEIVGSRGGALQFLKTYSPQGETEAGKFIFNFNRLMAYYQALSIKKQAQAGAKVREIVQGLASPDPKVRSSAEFMLTRAQGESDTSLLKAVTVLDRLSLEDVQKIRDQYQAEGEQGVTDLDLFNALSLLTSRIRPSQAEGQPKGKELFDLMNLAGNVTPSGEGAPDLFRLQSILNRMGEGPHDPAAVEAKIQQSNDLARRLAELNEGGIEGVINGLFTLENTTIQPQGENRILSNVPEFFVNGKLSGGSISSHFRNRVDSVVSAVVDERGAVDAENFNLIEDAIRATDMDTTTANNIVGYYWEQVRAKSRRVQASERPVFEVKEGEDPVIPVFEQVTIEVQGTKLISHADLVEIVHLDPENNKIWIDIEEDKTVKTKDKGLSDAQNAVFTKVRDTQPGQPGVDAAQAGLTVKLPLSDRVKTLLAKAGFTNPPTIMIRNFYIENPNKVIEKAR